MSVCVSQVQNARADGPVTWVFKQDIMSTYRMADDRYEYVSKYDSEKRKVNCFSDDQVRVGHTHTHTHVRVSTQALDGSMA